MKPGSASHQPHREAPSSLQLRFFIYEMGVIIAPASQSCWGLNDIISAWSPAQCLVYSEWWLLEDRTEVGMWLLVTALLS